MCRGSQNSVLLGLVSVLDGASAGTAAGSAHRVRVRAANTRPEAFRVSWVAHRPAGKAGALPWSEKADFILTERVIWTGGSGLGRGRLYAKRLEGVKKNDHD